jgi:hypothetical protein
MAKKPTPKYRPFRPEEHIPYCHVGQKVWGRFSGTTGVLLIVTEAAGDMAFVESTGRGIAAWVSIYALYPEQRPLEGE